ncbi:MAG: type II secretion system protein, partial [Actinomycetota bacterium]
MLTAIRERLARGREDEGFTLIELMVVVLIIAILIAIAIPTFLGAWKRAQDKQAQSNIRIALGTEETVYTDNQQYTSTVATLQGEEGSLVWKTGLGVVVEGAKREVAVEAVEGASQGVVLKSWSASGTLFCLLDIQSTLAAAFYGQTLAGTYYGKATGVLNNADCTAAGVT